MNEDLAVPIETVKGRTLMISGKILNTWKRKPLVVFLNGRKLRLVGGVYKKAVYSVLPLIR